MGILDLFGIKILPKKNKTVLDKVQEIGGKAIVLKFRQLGKQNNCAPSVKVSDKEIIEVYQKVGYLFRRTAEQKNELITAGILNNIVFTFLQVYENLGKTIFEQHLNYEIKKYEESELRADYKSREINLF